VNDAGTVTDSNIDGYYNHYSIKFEFIQQFINDEETKETINLRFGMKKRADKLYSNETKCSNADMNDMLGDIYIMDEFGMFRH